ncbi:MAG: hypothetical protein WCL53_09775 [Chloroflexota bacterium]
MSQAQINESSFWRAWRGARQVVVTSPAFWFVSLILSIASPLVAYFLFTPTGAEAADQVVIQTKTFAGVVLMLMLVVFLGLWVVTVPRAQRNEAWDDLRALRERRDWQAIIAELTEHIREGNREMEINGRPPADNHAPNAPYVDHTGPMLKFMNKWISDVRTTLVSCPEYMADFDNDRRGIFLGREVDGLRTPVVVEQLDVRLQHLAGIVRDIRANRL